MISMYKIPAGEHPLQFLAKRILSVNRSDTVVIVPTNRNLHKLVSIGAWDADIQTVADFNSRAILHRNVLLPQELRSYYLYKAATALSEEEQIRLMSRNASSFLKNYISFVQRSAALLPFFRELCAEQVDVQRLMKASLYQDYEEQLNVLMRLWDLYLTEIHSAGYVDEWESYVTLDLDTDYIQRYNRYIFLIGGYLNNFELKQMKMISDQREVEVYFNYTGERHPQQEKFAEYFGIEEIKTFDTDKTISWSSVQLPIVSGDGELVIRVNYTDTPMHTSLTDLTAEHANLQIVPCESAMAQYDMITRQICCAHWIEGIDLADMAVVLPEQRMARWFLYSDPYRLYNVSAGRDIESFPFFELFQNVIALLRGIHNGLIKLADIERLFAHPLFKELDDIDIHLAVDSLRNLTKSGRLLYTFDELRYSDLQGMQSLYKIITPFIGGLIGYNVMLESVKRFFMRFKDKLSGIERQALITIIGELDKMMLLYKGIDEQLPAKELVQRIVGELMQVRVPVEKGQVRVIGLLESRNMDYKILFIPDMNEDVFPADQNKDLFLNSELRRDLNLPTFSDRQELQKGYMNQIVIRAKSIYMTYTQSEETQPSVYVNEVLTASGHRFDDQIKEQTRSNILYRPGEYLILSPGDSRLRKFNTDIMKDAYLVKRLRGFKYSASSINMIKRCEYQFFYRYIESIEPVVEAVHEAGALEIGIILHNVLDKLFKQGVQPLDDAYLSRMNELFDQEASQYHYFRYNKVGIYEVKAMKSFFPRIVQVERARMNSGAVPKSFETKKEMVFNGIRLMGRIDRWDETSCGYAIIDYKYKNFYDLRETDNFQKLDVQLPLYALMMKEERGEYPSEILWFSLKKNPAFVQAYDPANLDRFAEELKAFFERWFTEDVPLAGAEDEAVCKYCDYATFCPKTLA